MHAFILFISELVSDLQAHVIGLPDISCHANLSTTIFLLFFVLYLLFLPVICVLSFGFISHFKLYACRSVELLRCNEVTGQGISQIAGSCSGLVNFKLHNCPKVYPAPLAMPFDQFSEQGHPRLPILL